jgi:hypothetical protein
MYERLPRYPADRTIQQNQPYRIYNRSLRGNVDNVLTVKDNKRIHSNSYNSSNQVTGYTTLDVMVVKGCN